MTYQIICNMKGSRSMTIDENHLRTIENFNLLADLLDSNGIVDENVLNKLQLNVRSLLDNTNGDPDLLNLCKDVIFHSNMKAFALHQLILLYIDWQKQQLENLKDEIETEAEV